MKGGRPAAGHTAVRHPPLPNPQWGGLRSTGFVSPVGLTRDSAYPRACERTSRPTTTPTPHRGSTAGRCVFSPWRIVG
jgi:hypothetical protein